MFPGKQAHPPLHRGDSVHLKVSGGNSNYTEEEKRVLLHSSHINDHEFVPFMSIDLREKFQYAIPFTDRDGLLELAPKQKLDFGRWCRPEELFSEPKMLMNHHVDYYSIKQTVSKTIVTIFLFRTFLIQILNVTLNFRFFPIVPLSLRWPLALSMKKDSDVDLSRLSFIRKIEIRNRFIIHLVRALFLCKLSKLF